MFDVESLHPSHKPMRAAACLANASVCLRAAEGFVAEAAELMRSAYGLDVFDERAAVNIGKIAQAMADMRDQIIAMEGL